MNQTCLTSFKFWLSAKSYSSSTIRNYLADINRYLQNISGDIFSPDSASAYLASINTDPNKNRYLSSLSKFFQFALDQKLITVDPLKKQRSNTPTPQNIVDEYQSFLIKKHFALVTVKNYLNDIQQFIDWLKSNPIAQ